MQVFSCAVHKKCTKCLEVKMIFLYNGEILIQTNTLLQCLCILAWKSIQKKYLPSIGLLNINLESLATFLQNSIAARYFEIYFNNYNSRYIIPRNNLLPEDRGFSKMHRTH